MGIKWNAEWNGIAGKQMGIVWESNEMLSVMELLELSNELMGIKLELNRWWNWKQMNWDENTVCFLIVFPITFSNNQLFYKYIYYLGLYEERKSGLSGVKWEYLQFFSITKGSRSFDSSFIEGLCSQHWGSLMRSSGWAQRLGRAELILSRDWIHLRRWLQHLRQQLPHCH